MIQRVADALGPRSGAEVNVILHTFDLPRADYEDWATIRDYVLSTLTYRDADDDAIAELDLYLRGDGPGNVEDGEQLWQSGALRLFLSHTSGHKDRAGQIASIASRIGIHAFVAHTTIEPTREWRDVIQTALTSCDALCAMVTPDFVQSPWCDQEVGYVLAQRKPVLALTMGAEPHGFLSPYQGIPSTADTDTSFDDVHRIVAGLIRQPATAAKTAPIAVQRYVRSGKEDSAREAFVLLKAIPPQAWTTAMIDAIDGAHVNKPKLRRFKTAEGERLSEAVEALLNQFRPPPATGPASDDDIPF